MYKYTEEQRHRYTSSAPEVKERLAEFEQKILCGAPVTIKPVYITSERPEKLRLSRRNV